MKLSTLIPGSQEYSGLQSCSSLSFDPTKDLALPSGSLLNDPSLIENEEDEEESLKLSPKPDILELEEYPKQSNETSAETKHRSRSKAKKSHSKRKNPGRHHSHDGTTGSDLFAMFESLQEDEEKPKKEKPKPKSSQKKKDSSGSKRKTPKRHHSHEATSGSDLFAMFDTLQEDQESGKTELLSSSSPYDKKKDPLSSVSAHGRKHPREKPRVPRRMNLTRSASTRSFAHRDKTQRRNSLNSGVVDPLESAAHDEKTNEILNRVQRRRGSCGEGSNGLVKQPQRAMSMRNLFRQQSRRSVSTEETKAITKNTSSFSSLGSVDVFSSDDESEEKMENYVFSVEAQDSNKSFLQLGFASVPE